MLQLTEGYGYTPTMVGICGEEGVMLCSDTRMVTVNDGEAQFIDDCRKIFQVNDGLIFGACGMFPIESRLIDPLVGADCETLNVVTAKKLVEDYLLEQMAVGELRECCYVLAGRDRGGKMCIAHVWYDEEDNTIHTDRQYGSDEYVIWLSLPPAASQEQELWTDKLRESLIGKNGMSTASKIMAFFGELAGVSKFVGGEFLHREILEGAEEQ